MFLIEAKQAGIFQVRNMPPDEVEPVLAINLSKYPLSLSSGSGIEYGRFTPGSPLCFNSDQFRSVVPAAETAAGTKHKHKPQRLPSIEYEIACRLPCLLFSYSRQVPRMRWDYASVADRFRHSL